jgi:hypothetical protein
MKRGRVLLGIVAVVLAALATADYAHALPSEGFYRAGSDIFDSFGICRTRAFDEDGYYQLTETGFRPVIAFQSMGEQASVAHRLAEQIAARYPDPLQRAEAIFHLVRDRVEYTSDITISGSEEFAQNADELAAAIAGGAIAQGDCEDMTVLLAVMYRAAGFRSAIVLVPQHTALLIYLPEYSRATAFFELAGEPGWIWAEATGRNNPLGWVPEQYLDLEISAYEISAEIPAFEISADGVVPPRLPPAPSLAFATTGAGANYLWYLFFIMIGFLWCISLLGRRRRRRG